MWGWSLARNTVNQLRLKTLRVGTIRVTSRHTGERGHSTRDGQSLMIGTSHAKRRLAAIFALALGAGVSACSTSEPPPLALALESSQMTGEAALPEGTAVVPTSRPDAEETTSTVKTAAAEQPAGETVQVAADEAMPEPGAETAPGDTTQLAMQAPELPKVAPAADAPAPSASRRCPGDAAAGHRG